MHGRGNACTDDACDGTGARAHVPNTAPCDDGLFCNGADACAGGACSVHAGDPCAGGGECSRTCDDAAGTCFDPAGSVCADLAALDCRVAACDGAGTCSQTYALESTGTACRAGADGTCDALGACAPPLPFAYAPSNFDPAALAPAAGAAIELDCDAVYDSTTDSFPTWCGPLPATVTVAQPGGPDARVLVASWMSLAAGRTLTVQGSLPVIFAVFGDAAIDGLLVARAGAGGAACSGGVGANGASVAFGPASGGGGGGFGASGASGGGAGFNGTRPEAPRAA